MNHIYLIPIVETETGGDWSLGHIDFIDNNNNHINPDDYNNATISYTTVSSTLDVINKCQWSNGFIIECDQDPPQNNSKNLTYRKYCY